MKKCSGEELRGRGSGSVSWGCWPLKPAEALKGPVLPAPQPPLPGVPPSTRGAPWAAAEGVTADRDQSTTDLTVSLRAQEAVEVSTLDRARGQTAC